MDSISQIIMSIIRYYIYYKLLYVYYIMKQVKVLNFHFEFCIYSFSFQTLLGGNDGVF